jgi:GH35 family endo-1,4-beta-xylanase
MNRRTFLKTSAGTAALLAGGIGLGAEPPEAELLAGASESIDRHRKSDLVVVALDESGKPAGDVKVKVEQLRHDFLFGCNFFMFGRTGNATDDDTYRQRFAAVMNYCTLGFYWGNYEAEKARPRYEYTDQVVEWTMKQGIACKGHPLVWDHPAGSPRWLPEDKEEIDRLSKARVKEIVGRFRGRIDIWDVVNEATHLPDKVNQTRMAGYAAAKGPVAYVREHLEVARAANPKATLVVNDYRTDPPYFRLLEELLAGGQRLFDVVGIQSHMHGGLWAAKRISEVCDQYAGLGLPLHFTETTLVSGPRRGRGENWGETAPELEVKQAEDTEKFYTLLFAHPAVRGLTWWDFSDRGAWQRAAAGWLRKDMSPKPVYERMLGLIKGKWWTKAEGTTNAGGEYRGRGFCGTYAASAEFSDGRRLHKDFVLEPGKKARVEMRA